MPVGLARVLSGALLIHKVKKLDLQEAKSIKEKAEEVWGLLDQQSNSEARDRIKWFNNNAANLAGNQERSRAFLKIIKFTSKLILNKKDKLTFITSQLEQLTEQLEELNFVLERIKPKVNLEARGAISKLQVANIKLKRATRNLKMSPTSGPACNNFLEAEREYLLIKKNSDKYISRIRDHVISTLDMDKDELATQNPLSVKTAEELSALVPRVVKWEAEIDRSIKNVKANIVTVSNEVASELNKQGSRILTSPIDRPLIEKEAQRVQHANVEKERRTRSTNDTLQETSNLVSSLKSELQEKTNLGADESDLVECRQKLKDAEALQAEGRSILGLPPVFDFDECSLEEIQQLIKEFEDQKKQQEKKLKKLEENLAIAQTKQLRVQVTVLEKKIWSTTEKLEQLNKDLSKLRLKNQ
ncbi:MAG: hypothetical protein V4591_01415 [Bdellovibrionota bacterium]